MEAPGKTVEEILDIVPKDCCEPFNKIHQVIIDNLPKGFEAVIRYGGLGYVVPHTIYPKHSKQKLDLGKSCIRFKKMDQIPYDLVADLMKKMTVQDWIAIYEEQFIPKKR